MHRRLTFTILALTLAVAACSPTGDDTTPGSATSSVPRLGDVTTTTTAAIETDATPAGVAGVNPAPDFPDGLDWLNVGAPLSFADLAGKVVLLDFWTYGCINCIHIIPDLKRLEAEYPDELVVIGVHSAKFTNESATENIRQVVLRYGIEHPVVNDPDFTVWSTWGVNAWPTVFLVDPAGNVLGSHAGESVYEVTEPLIAAMVDEFGARGEIDRGPIDLALESEGLPQTLLSYPGKVLASPQADQLFVADTGNHRIVEVVPSTGEVTAVYGSGRAGFTDGAALEAQFNSPQGMALSADLRTLFVADTNNHAIRMIDLDSGAVTTAVGTGDQASTYPPAPGSAPDVELSSPWDLELHDGLLYIAMAGSHQIWSYDLATGAAAAVVGTGGESTRNGPAVSAELAQPSGLVVGDDGRLYFADSESSSIRLTDLASSDLTTTTLAGSDLSLFEFGDEDGLGTQARLQHPLGIEWDPATATVVFADTYNSKIKEVDPATGQVATIYGAEQGWADGTDARFFEPGGLSLSGSVLYVADTNNHAIRAIDRATGDTRTIVLRGIDAFAPPPDDADFAGAIVELDPVATGVGIGTFVLDITLPPNHKVNEEAPSSVTWSVTGSAVAFDAAADRSLTGATFPIEVTADFVTGDAVVTADLTVIYCHEDAESLCFIQQVRFRVPVAAGDEATSPRIPLPYRIELPNL